MTTTISNLALPQPGWHFYKNAAWNGQRDYDATQIVFAVGPDAPGPHWVPCSDGEADTLMQRPGFMKLSTENQITFYGWL